MVEWYWVALALAGGLAVGMLLEHTTQGNWIAIVALLVTPDNVAAYAKLFWRAAMNGADYGAPYKAWLRVRYGTEEKFVASVVSWVTALQPKVGQLRSLQQ